MFGNLSPHFQIRKLRSMRKFFWLMRAWRLYIMIIHDRREHEWLKISFAWACCDCINRIVKSFIECFRDYKAAEFSEQFLPRKKVVGRFRSNPQATELSENCPGLRIGIYLGQHLKFAFKNKKTNLPRISCFFKLKRF